METAFADTRVYLLGSKGNTQSRKRVNDPSRQMRSELAKLSIQDGVLMSDSASHVKSLSDFHPALRGQSMWILPLYWGPIGIPQFWDGRGGMKVDKKKFKYFRTERQDETLKDG
jgi:hypothetical protein